MSAVRRRGSYSFLLPALLFFLVLVLSDQRPSSAQAQSNHTCTTSCACMSDLVICHRRGLTSIPSNLDPTTNHLILMDQPFIDKTLRRHNVSYLRSLVSLQVTDCGIVALEVGVFSDLSRLRVIDLSNNNISVIEDFTFRGLTLTYIKLNNNRHLQLRPKSFKGSFMDGLFMKNCGLRQLSFETFSALNNPLVYLKLSKNKLLNFGPLFEFIFSRLRKIDVTDNPLRCNCRLQWFVRYMKRSRNVIIPRDYDKRTGLPMGYKEPRCASPPELAGIALRSLSLNQLNCDSPRHTAENPMGQND